MECNNKNCKFYKICSKILNKKTIEGGTVYTIPALPITKLPKNCIILEYLQGK